MALSKKNMRWLMAFALLGIMGCSKVELPRVGAAAASAQAGARDLSGQSEFDKICQELPTMSEIPLFTVEEYAPLIEFVKSLSPLLREDNPRFLRAHARALRRTNESVAELLVQHHKTVELQYFRGGITQNIRYGRPSLTTDLPTMLNQVMQLSAGSKCGNAYLAHFYARFVQELDPYGDATFGLTEHRAQESTLALDTGMPDSIRNAAPTRMAGNVMVVTLPKFERTPALDEALQTLETSWAAQGFKGILLDLRYSSGAELPVIARFQASAAKGWGVAPMMIWTNRWTKGVPAVLAKQYSSLQHRNVLVIGSDDETYGYGRRLVQQSTTLVQLHPVTVTIGAEVMQPPGLVADPDGFRLQFPIERILANDSVDSAIDRCDQWIAQAPPGDPAVTAAPEVAAVDPGSAPANPASAETPGGEMPTAPVVEGDPTAANPAAPASEVHPEPVNPEGSDPAAPPPTLEAPPGITKSTVVPVTF